MTPSNITRVLTVSQVAEAIGVSDCTVRRWAIFHGLPAYQARRRITISPESLAYWAGTSTVVSGEVRGKIVEWVAFGSPEAKDGLWKSNEGAESHA